MCSFNFFLDKSNKKMSASDFDDIMDTCLSDLVEIKDFKNMLNVMRYYHIDSCSRQGNCPYCFFFNGFFLIYAELKSQKTSFLLYSERRNFYFYADLHP